MKRFLALLLTLVMLISVCGLQAFAADGEFGHASGLRPTARQGRASRAFPPTAQIGRERRGAENALLPAGERVTFSRRW